MVDLPTIKVPETHEESTSSSGGNTVKRSNRKGLSLGRALRHVSRNKLIVLSLFIGGITIIAAIAPGLLTTSDPQRQDLIGRLTPPSLGILPGSSNVLGTDNLGRDVYARIIYGARITIVVGLGAVVLGGILGALCGLAGGYYGGPIDALATMLIDIQMGFPGMLLALLVVVMLGTGVTNLILIIGFIGWPGYARVIRSAVISLREREFIQACRTVGCRDSRILFRHVLPNVLPLFVPLAIMDLGRAILSEASLSFLGFGIQPPDASWGLMLSEGRDYIYSNWWLITFPGIAIAVTVLAANLVGTWLQEQVDPLRKGGATL